jgi:hypothetical protein
MGDESSHPPSSLERRRLPRQGLRVLRTSVRQPMRRVRAQRRVREPRADARPPTPPFRTRRRRVFNRRDAGRLRLCSVELRNAGSPAQPRHRRFRFESRLEPRHRRLLQRDGRRRPRGRAAGSSRARGVRFARDGLRCGVPGRSAAGLRRNRSVPEARCFNVNFPPGSQPLAQTRLGTRVYFDSVLSRIQRRQRP